MHIIRDQLYANYAIGQAEHVIIAIIIIIIMISCSSSSSSSSSSPISFMIMCV